MSEENNDLRISSADEAFRFWLYGTGVVRHCLAEAEAGEYHGTMEGLSASEREIWLRAEVEAYRHALSMMGVADRDRELIQSLA